MAGVFPVPVKTSGRKQWTLYNGTKGHFGRFGSQLAEDGSPDSQVVLAKQLLDEKTDQDIDQEENARLGVYWLIKASEQGHEEATTILRHCLETGQGVTEHNFLDVKACLTMSQEEKVARRAARELFASMSAGEDFITSDQLQDRMSRLDAIHSPEMSATNVSNTKEEVSTPDWKDRCGGSGEKLTEDMLVSAASTYSRGELPLVQRSLSLNSQNGLSRNFFCTALFLPFLTIRSSCHQIIDTIGQQSLSRYIFPFVAANLQAAVFMWFFLTFGLDGVIAMLPSAVYFGSLILMLVATCQALSKKRDFQHFRRWSNLFIAYSSGDLNPSEAEYQHVRNNLRPYAVFFISLIIHLLLTPTLLQMSTPQSEITVVAFVCTFLTLYNFTISGARQGGKSPDFLALFSFGVHVLAKYPYETDAVVSRGWRFLDVHVPTFASYIVGNGVEFCLNFRALFYLVIPAILFKMALRDNWKGTYTSLVPHCMSLAWWQVAVLSSQGSTWYGLIRSALALVGFVLFLPLAGLASVFLPLLAAGKFLVETDEFMDIVTTAALATVPVLLAFYIGRKKTQEKRSFLAWIQFFLLMFSGMLFVWPVVHQKPSPFPTLKTMPSTLSWIQYRDFCESETESIVATQLKCASLAGQPVKWEGRIAAFRLVSVHNPIAQLIQRLPLNVQSVVNCWFGEQFNMGKCNRDSESDCEVPPELAERCNIANWDRYEFEMDILMSSGLWRGGEFGVTLSADNSFRNFTGSLAVGDHVWFAGNIVGDYSGLLTNDRAWVDLKEIGCLVCKDDSLKTASKSQIFTVLSIWSGFKAVLNFLFNPLVIFR